MFQGARAAQIEGRRVPGRRRASAHTHPLGREPWAERAHHAGGESPLALAAGWLAASVRSIVAALGPRRRGNKPHRS